MIIKKLSMDEIPQLIELHNELMSGYAENDVQTTQKIYQEIVDNDNYLVLVAKENDKIIGTATGVCCKILAFAGKNFLVVEDVIVAESAKRKGVGRGLFEALDSFAAEKNCAYAILCSSASRNEAHPFYEKMGYTDHVRGFRKMYQ